MLTGKAAYFQNQLKQLKSGTQSKLSQMSQSNRDMQNYIDSKTSGGFKVPLGLMITEEMYRANFILDKWLKRK